MHLILTHLLALSNADSVLPTPLVASFTPFLGFEFTHNTVAVAAIIGGISLAAIVVVSAMFFSYRKRQLWHETARIALEKGQPLPPMPLTDEEMEHQPPAGVSFAEWQHMKRVQSRGHDIKGGLVLLAVGLGLYLMLPANNGAASAIPASIGVALLVHAFFDKIPSRNQGGSNDRAPRS